MRFTNFPIWSIISGTEEQPPINLLNVRPIPDIFLPLRSLIYWALSAKNMATKATLDISSGIN